MSIEEETPAEPGSIRSFVRRQGRYTPAQRHAFERLWPIYGLDLSQGGIEPVALFPQCKTCVVEIGFGMGQTLIDMARQAPDTGFVGIEVHRPGVGKLLAMVEQEQLGNVRVYCEDAVEVFRRAIPDASLAGVLMFFPDPWPKKRQQKRRLLQPAFAELVTSKLHHGGVFHLATDWHEYAQQMLDVLSATPMLENVAGGGCFAARPESRPQTRFEERGVRLGHGVWDLLFRRVDIASNVRLTAN